MDFNTAFQQIIGNVLADYPFLSIFISSLFVAFVMWLILNFVFSLFNKLGGLGR